MKATTTFKILTGFVFLLASVGLQGASFTSEDNTFMLDMPSGWKKVANPPAESVLTLQKNTATINIKKITCNTEKCLDERINRDLADVKSKKMTVVSNTYTGEEIKRIEFSTGEPIYYISFFTPKNDFSAGYFLMNGNAYSILAKNITYAEADLIFSFFTPVRLEEKPAKTIDIGFIVDHASERSYHTEALPEVEVAPLDENPAQSQATADDTQADVPAEKIPFGNKFKEKLGQIKANLAKSSVRTLVSPNAPPYIRQLGHLFDVIILLFLCLFGIWIAALFVRLFIRPKQQEEPANPNALYPIFIRRLYGTPSLIFRAKDNQGNILIALSNRWSSIFVFAGMFFVIATLFVLAGTGFLEQTQLFHFSEFVYNTIYAICALIIPLGLLLIVCGIVWGLLVLREITLFDRKGKKAALIVQKGFHLLREEYDIYFARSKDILHVQRRRFYWRRMWTLTDSQGHTLATFTEQHAGRALVRRLLGHLWGFLRASYTIIGPMDSQGTLQNTCHLFNKLICNMDKPEALLARDALAVTILISIRDRDKWYPWFN